MSDLPWISVEDRLPEEVDDFFSAECLVARPVSNFHRFNLAFYNWDTKQWECDDWDRKHDSSFTHWLPITPPKGAK